MNVDDLNAKNSTELLKKVNRRRLHFDQGGLGLGSSARDYYLNETRYAKQMGAYEEYMNNKIRLFARDAGSKRTDEEIAQSVKAILNFEKKFAAILVPEEQRRNYTKMYNVRRFTQLPEIFGEIDWNTYFKGLMPVDLSPLLFGLKSGTNHQRARIFQRKLDRRKLLDIKSYCSLIMT
ncbi:peptidase family m13 domain-containing protein [Ditylenchus destructor]|nr:peptidase family m13 domain-containing protein [Ditylenchus destructor]